MFVRFTHYWRKCTNGKLNIFLIIALRWSYMTQCLLFWKELVKTLVKSYKVFNILKRNAIFFSFFFFILAENFFFFYIYLSSNNTMNTNQFFFSKGWSQILCLWLGWEIEANGSLKCWKLQTRPLGPVSWSNRERFFLQAQTIQEGSQPLWSWCWCS